ncbi:condensation domain-containing protein [Streptomyces olivaceoviridis]|uniref:condensation domain-containing protein n=1 Tax=Streptomyces olivaceoviridis TaxID=1921 RepID=UPI0037AC80C9
MDTEDDTTAVAVVGLAFEFPQCDDWDTLTEILRAGRDCLGPMPAARARATGVTRSDSDQEGGWIDDITGFDHRAFGLSRAEAELIDPRQRKMLQLAVRAIGHAGYAPAELRGHDVCVYTAGYGGPEPTLYELLDETGRRHGAALTGSIRAFAAGRIAYHLDLRGSAMVVDTACSSFLVALHEARRKLAYGECASALVGGYELVLGRPPSRPEGADGLGVLSATGRCRPFDEKSDGTTFGEGGGFVLLKRLADALRDGDTVHAVIRGSAVNQDAGRSNGLTAPSPAGQSQVIAAALRDAAVDPATIGYVEAHGTGTRIGDPIEIQGLAAALSEVAADFPATARASALPVSSAKGNFGHLDCMAGFAGLVRIIAQFRAGEIFPTAHFTAPNPLLGLDGTALRVADRCEPWPTGALPRRGGLSSFGLSSTNAHVIVEEGTAARPAVRPTAPARTDHVVVLSARDASGLRRYAEQLRQAVAADPRRFPLADAADVLTLGRDHGERFAHRRAWAVTDAAHLLGELDGFLAATDPAATDAAGTGTTVRAPLVLALGSPRDTAADLDAAHLSDLAEAFPGFARVLDEARRHVPAQRWTAGQRHLLRLAGVRALLADLAVTPDLVLVHGIGALADRYARGTVDLPTALAQADQEAHTAAPDAGRLRAALAGFAGPAVVVDLAPDSALSLLLREEAGSRFETVTPRSPAELLAACHRRGFPLDWHTGLGRRPRRRIELPTAPFAEEHCWPDTALATPVAEGPSDAPAGAGPERTAIGTTPAALVLELARDVLKEPGLGLDDDFFEAGGNSLNGVQLITRLNDRLGTDLDVMDLFDFASLGELAASLGTEPPVGAAAPTATGASAVTASGGTAVTARDGSAVTASGGSAVTASGGSVEAAVPAAVEGPLSGQQAAIWAAVQLTPGSAAYNVASAFLLDGSVDPQRLTRRLEALVRRHPMLRVTLHDAADGPVQVISPPEEARLTLERLTLEFPGTTAADGRDRLLARLKDLVAEPLDLYGGTPARYQLVQARFDDRDQHVLVLTFHHLFFDGWSWRILMDDLSSDTDRPAPARTYLDYVREQRELLDGERGRQLVEFWRKRLAGVPAVTLPADVADADPSRLPERGADLPFPIEPELAARLRALAREARGTLNMVLLAGWMALLWKIGGSRDVSVASAVTGRVSGHDDVIGCYANTVVVRAALVPEEPFSALLAAVRDAQLSALSHGDLPADRIVRIARPHSAEPAATTNFSFHNAVEPLRGLGPDGPAVELLDVDPAAPTFPLSVSVMEYGDALWAGLKYATDLFRPETVAAWLDEYRTLLRNLAERGPGATLFDLFDAPSRTGGTPDVPDFTF